MNESVVTPNQRLIAMVAATAAEREPLVAVDQAEPIAKEHNSRTRHPLKENPRQPRRIARHRTGRNQQFNIKATADTIERFYKLADKRRVALGELLEQGLDAIERLEELDKAADREALREAGRRLDAWMAKLNVSEDDLVADFERSRKKSRSRAR